MSLIVPRAAFRLVRVTLKTWELRSERDAVKRGHFCPTCGVRICHDGGETSAEISVKAGSLDDTRGLQPVAHIWTKNAQPWVPIPEDALCYAGEPDSDDAAQAACRSKPV